MRAFETAVPLWGDRHFPVQAVAEQAKMLEADPAVDGVLLCDAIPNWLPQQLWTPEKTPLAHVMADPDSSVDVFALAAYAMAGVSNLNLSVTTDSIRRAPAELIQTMLTLSIMAGGNASFQIGGGEAKQCQPFGHKRTQGMSRMKDLFEIFTRLMDSDEPIDYEGRRWTFEKATLGKTKPHRPKILGLGGGPMLIDHAAKYADGLAIMCPSVYPTPAEFAEAREGILRKVEENGRDPEAFSFAVWFPVLLHEDPEVIEQALRNELVRWIAGTAGRIGPTEMWRDAGLEPPIPDGWVYYEKFVPYDMDTAFVEDVVAKSTPEHARAFWMAGSVDEVSDTIAEWIAAGVDWVCPMDYATTMALGFDEAENSVRRQIEVCQGLRTRATAAAA